MPVKQDVMILGAGAAGLMAAITAGQRGKSVTVLDHANKAGKKILMSGGGRCNFTNLHVKPHCYISNNPHFCRSALSRYTPKDFIQLVEKHQIAYYEKTLGQLFCEQKSKQIVNMLLQECQDANVSIQMNSKILQVERLSNKTFKIKTEQQTYICSAIIVATGGLSIPTMGATAFGYELAKQFGLRVWPTRAGLVPFTLHQHDKEKFEPLSGIGLDCEIQCQTQSFRENILLTHRGISGPAALQISSYWTPGKTLNINLLPENDLYQQLSKSKNQQPKITLANTLSQWLPKRFIQSIIPETLKQKQLANCSKQDLTTVCSLLEQWQIKPNNTEGYRTAEVTLGGVDTHALSSKTMEATTVPGLYFIGEVVDVTGWLGGYNFQWAWASGFAAGQAV